MSNSRGPVVPTKAVFHDVATARPVIPSWMKAPEPATLVSLTDPPPSGHPAPRPAPLAQDRPAQAPSEARPAASGMALPFESGESLGPAFSSPRSEPVERDAVHEELNRAALGELEHALSTFEHEKRAFFEEAEKKLLVLAKLVSERVIERAIEGDDDLLSRLVREGLSSLQTGGQVLVSVGSGFENASKQLADATLETGVSLAVQLDPNAPTFSCRLRAELGEVDESLETRLDLVMASLEADGMD